MKKTDYKTIKQASDYYHQRFSKGMKIVSNNEALLINRWICDCKLINNAIILDLGTGTGRVINILVKQRIKKIYAVDNSPAMLTYLKRLYRKKIQNNGINTILASSDKIPLTSNSIDLITSLHLFKHLRNINPTLKEVSRLLKPGGYFIFECLNYKSLIRFNLGSCFALKEFEIVQKLCNTGFKVVNITYMHSLGETIYGKIGQKLTFIIQVFDKIIGRIYSKSGTKIFILAQKT